jgi:hypothetical protein
MNNVIKQTRLNFQNMFATAGTIAMLYASAAVAQESVENRMQTFEDRIGKLEVTKELTFGVGVETLYILADHSESSRDKTGSYFLDKIELIVSGEFDNGLYYSSRWDYQVTQQGFFPAWTYVGLEHNDSWKTEVGVVMQPLGAGVDGSYYDNSFLSDVPLWIGLAHNPDLGIKTQYKKDAWHWVFMFSKNSELSGGNANARFRPDVVAQGEISPRGFDGETFRADVEPINTFHGGGAYTFDLNSGATIQLGSNAQTGDYYNTFSNDDGGDHWAATAFANYRTGGFAFTVQGLAYDYNIKNAPGIVQSEDSTALSTGALVPADGTVYSTRLSYTMPASIGVFDTIKFYHDYDYLASGSEDRFTANDVQFSILGAHFSTGAFNTWVSVLTTKNANFANGGPARVDNQWHTQFTITGALYF